MYSVKTYPDGGVGVVSDVRKTPSGRLYLRHPGALLLARQRIMVDGLADILAGYPSELGYAQYIEDDWSGPDGELLIKVAGQCCYMSFGKRRRKNDQLAEYLTNLKESGHGSVLEHATYTIIFYGISRSCTHEIVRHRAGFAYSQVSQRFVDPATCRFVLPPAFEGDEVLEQLFWDVIDQAHDNNRKAYDRLRARMIELGRVAATDEERKERRKFLRQAARAVLPNMTEGGPITVTGNGRAWRHFIEMRCNPGAESEIQRMAYVAYLCLKKVAPVLFDDYTFRRADDGSLLIDTPYRKV